MQFQDRREWLETDGLGGFASGTVHGIRTRRYHALLLSAARPPADRYVLVNGFEAWVETPQGIRALTSQAYPPEVIHPDGATRIESFSTDPWPRWVFRLDDGPRIAQEIFVPKGIPAVCVSWKLLSPAKGVRLFARPLLSGRDPHGLHHENPLFRFDPEPDGDHLIWRPYPGLPGVLSHANADYEHRPEWYRNFLYAEERDRGLDFLEDLASPGVYRWDLSKGEAAWILSAEGIDDSPARPASDAADRIRLLRAEETRRRGTFADLLHRSAADYLVRRGAGRTLIAGYPWFSDWGRDTFIALRGICLATGRLEEAGEILREWAGAVSAGMLPNRFPDRGEEPEYNSVDASLWYVIAIREYLEAMQAAGKKVSPGEEKLLRDAVETILDGYARGTRYGIRMEADHLIACGVPGVQLTWMDAKVGDWVVTPRSGKPVEIQALWINALDFAKQRSPRWGEVQTRALHSFRERFWNEAAGCLYDVVDVDHVPGTTDPSIRPNQIFAVGGLPLQILDPEKARKVVDAVETRLLTPLGLRSLAPGSPGYCPRYEGGVRERDGAYHQGTVWPWLIGPFVEAWVRVREGSAKARQEARKRFFDPILAHLDEAGLGHVSEITDAEAPHTPRGCPFQAWSVGEAIRIQDAILGGAAARPGPRPRARPAATTRKRPRPAARP
jgi:predicted glycogen debranching enzyme